MNEGHRCACRKTLRTHTDGFTNVCCGFPAASVIARPEAIFPNPGAHHVVTQDVQIPNEPFDVTSPSSP